MICRASFAMALLLLFGCAAIHMPGDREGCPVDLVSTNQLPDGLSLRARMRIKVAKHDIPFEVVARSTPDALNIVGITPYGTRLFKLQQQGRQYSVAPETSPEARIVAIYALDALYRAYWIQPPGEATSWNRGGEHISESREKGERRRKFRRTGWGAGFRSVRVAYNDVDGFPGGQDARVENPWCGYRAAIALLDASEKG